MFWLNYLHNLKWREVGNGSFIPLVSFNCVPAGNKTSVIHRAAVKVAEVPVIKPIALYWIIVLLPETLPVSIYAHIERVGTEFNEKIMLCFAVNIS